MHVVSSTRPRRLGIAWLWPPFKTGSTHRWGAQFCQRRAVCGVHNGRHADSRGSTAPAQHSLLTSQQQAQPQPCVAPHLALALRDVSVQGARPGDLRQRPRQLVSIVLGLCEDDGAAAHAWREGEGGG